MSDDALDEYIRSDVSNAIRAFACFPAQERCWSGFILYCVEIGVAFIHAFEQEMQTECNGKKLMHLRKTSVLSRLSKQYMMDVAKGRTVPEDFEDFCNHCRGHALHQQKTEENARLKAEIDALKKEKEKLFDRINRKLDDVSQFDQAIRTQQNKWQSDDQANQATREKMKESLSRLESSLALFQDGQSGVSQENLQLIATILHDIKNFLPTESSLENSKLLAENQELRRQLSSIQHPTQTAVSASNRIHLKEMEDILKKVESNKALDESALDFDTFNQKSTAIANEMCTDVECQHILKKCLDFAFQSAKFFATAHAVAQKKPSEKYDDSYIEKLKSWQSNFFMTFVPHLYGHKDMGELIRYQKYYQDRKTKFGIDIDLAITLHMDLQGSDLSNAMIKIVNNPSKQTPYSCMEYDKKFHEYQHSLCCNFITHLLILVKDQVSDLTFAQLAEIYKTYFNEIFNMNIDFTTLKQVWTNVISNIPSLTLLISQGSYLPFVSGGARINQIDSVKFKKKILFFQILKNLS
jgi:hypothetical protein